MKLKLQNFPRMGDEITQQLFRVFQDAGILARFVGGCVRDAILGVAAEDIDLAVPIPPDEVIYILTNAQIKIIPTGYEFGTVTAVFHNRAFQITSLRQDWETDGRYPRVTYGTDWKADAARRDFTINALYADRDGTVIDFFGGINDLEAGIVRFIGNAEQRIQEDYLRILRYFRFLAWYGHGEVDAQAIEACTNLNYRLEGLSKERIGHEFLKLLAAPNPLKSISLLDQINLSPFVVSRSLNLITFENLLRLERERNSLCRLVALLLPRIHVKEASKALRLSKEQRQYLQSCHDRLGDYLNQTVSMDRNLYKDGGVLFMDLTLLSLALKPFDAMEVVATEAFEVAKRWKRPTFPLKGQDLLDLGMKPGLALGNLLKRCEEWWIDQHFSPNREACLQWVLEQREQV